MSTSDSNSALLDTWCRHFGAVRGAPASSETAQRLLDAWREPQRAYHTAQHLAECMELLERWGAGSPRQHEIGIALWFHDIVYDTHATDNEDRSIDVAWATLAPTGVPADVLGHITRLIEVTKHGAAAPASDAERLMVDIDLSILGASQYRFAEYCDQVRKEYAWVPHEVYVAKRAEFLEQMLARAHIFEVDVARREREERARANLAGELARLRGVQQT